ncbi:hypothetical protein C0J52_08698, partial [Blattella germanica]
ERLSELLAAAIICLEQFRLCLYSSPDVYCPETENEPKVPNLELPYIGSPPIVQATEGSEVWKVTANKIKHLIAALSKIKNTVEKSGLVSSSQYDSKTDYVPESTIVAVGQYDTLTESYKQLEEEIVNAITNVKINFESCEKLSETEYVKSKSKNPMVQSLNWLENYIIKEVKEFKLFQKEVQNLANSKFTTTAGDNVNNESVVVKKFRDDTAQFCETILLIIQNINKKYTSNSTGPIVYDDEKSSEIHDLHLQEKTINSLTDTFAKLQIKKINDDLHDLLQRLRIILENDADQGNACKRLLLHCFGCLDQLLNLYQFFVIQQISAYRVICKMLSILLGIFIQLAHKGYCLPSDVSIEDIGDKESRLSGMGLGEGQGEEDRSDQIESEEQLEEARPKDEEKAEEDNDCKLWRIDSEDEPDDKDDEPEEIEEDEKEERGSGEQIGESELGAKEEKQEGKTEDEDDTEGSKEKEPKKKDINEMEEGEEDDDHIDPYHGKQEPQPEPEALDLPEDLQLDDGEKKEEEDEDVQAENPFDIDKMKEQENEEDKELPEEKGEEEPMDIEEKEDDKDGDGLGQEQEQEKEEAEAPAEENMEEEKTGGSKDEEKSGEEPKKGEEPEKEEETAAASEDPPTHMPAEAATDMDQTSGSKDQVVPKEEDKSEMPQQKPEESMAQGEDKDQGVGQAKVEESTSGHQGPTTASQENMQTANPQQELKEEKKQRFRESDNDRSLGEVNEPAQKKLKMMNISSVQEEREEQEEELDGVEQQKNSDMYQHIKEAEKTYDAQTMDAATEEQAEKQPIPNMEEQEAEEIKDEETMDIVEEPEPPTVEEAPKLNAEKVSSEKKVDDNNKEKTAGEKVDEGGDVEMVVEVEGEKVETVGVARGNETTFHTMPSATEAFESVHPELSSAEIDQALRSEMEMRLAAWSQPPPDKQAENTWVMFSNVTDDLARDLSEQLRLVLEPSQASRLQGDYRTGRRINMRKVIPYIASQFRKDKIWLRRTKPSKRDYQIVLAIDDSSSMADNHSKGNSVDNLTMLLQQFTFEQKNTRVGQLVDFVTAMFMSSRRRISSSNEKAQLLVIVSDGRIINEGHDKVVQAVRRAKENNVFMVFVIIDNPENKDSILDIQQPLFVDAKCIGFKPYLDNFPFPFYLILRDINSLPTVLCDALRQWFELVASNVGKWESVFRWREDKMELMVNIVNPPKMQYLIMIHKMAGITSKIVCIR